MEGEVLGFGLSRETSGWDTASSPLGCRLEVAILSKETLRCNWPLAVAGPPGLCSSASEPREAGIGLRVSGPWAEGLWTRE